ncbi:MAG: DUF998 domain-containing protein [Candidatus Omnitrophica bacterium]|nr:DUF998 domain-containing protein [Candidatus Omnitrophota bacterium]
MLNFQTKTLNKILPIIAFSIPVSALISFILSIHFSPEFKILKELVSELGYYPKGYCATKAGSHIFNYGMAFTGLISVVCSTLISKSNLKNLFSNTSCILLTAMSFSLMFLGIIHESASKYHLVISVIFFILIPFCLFSAGKDLFKNNMIKLGKTNKILGIINFALLPILLMPPLELIPIICLIFIPLQVGTLSLKLNS